jgi:hypothetical protein
MKLGFLDGISKNTEISNFIKIRSVRAELFCADGQMDVLKLIVAIRNFANAPKISSWLLVYWS